MNIQKCGKKKMEEKNERKKMKEKNERKNGPQVHSNVTTTTATSVSVFT